MTEDKVVNVLQGMCRQKPAPAKKRALNNSNAVPAVSKWSQIKIKKKEKWQMWIKNGHIMPYEKSWIRRRLPWLERAMVKPTIRFEKVDKESREARYTADLNWVNGGKTDKTILKELQVEIWSVFGPPGSGSISQRYVSGSGTFLFLIKVLSKILAKK